jgi:hypothetical protein
LDEAYAAMQNGLRTESWTLEPIPSLRPLVAPVMRDGIPMGHRSTSMGDVLERDGRHHVVDTFGFAELDLPVGA